MTGVKTLIQVQKKLAKTLFGHNFMLYLIIFNLILRKVSFFSTRRTPGTWGGGGGVGDEVWKSKGENRRILQILLKKKLKSQNVNLYLKNVT